MILCKSMNHSFTISKSINKWSKQAGETNRFSRKLSWLSRIDLGDKRTRTWKLYYTSIVSWNMVIACLEYLFVKNSNCVLHTKQDLTTFKMLYIFDDIIWGSKMPSLWSFISLFIFMFLLSFEFLIFGSLLY